jgi:hypothetical protein
MSVAVSMFSMTTDSVISSLTDCGLTPVSCKIMAKVLMSAFWLNCLLERLTVMKSGWSSGN